MRHIQHNIETGLIINKNTALNMASVGFFKNKRATEVHIRSYNKLIVISYSGQRSDLEEIRGNVEVVRVVKMENREVVK